MFDVDNQNGTWVVTNWTTGGASTMNLNNLAFTIRTQGNAGRLIVDAETATGRVDIKGASGDLYLEGQQPWRFRSNSSGNVQIKPMTSDGDFFVANLAGTVRFGARPAENVSYVSFDLRESLQDKDGQTGAAGQVLSSTGTQTDWITLPTPTPDGNGMFDSGNNNGTIGITTANFSSGSTTTFALAGSSNSTAFVFGSSLGDILRIRANRTMTVTANMQLAQQLQDGSSSSGTSGQLLSSTGTGVAWVDPSSGSGFWTQTTSDLYPNSTAWSVGVGTNVPAVRFHANEPSGDMRARLSAQGTTTDEVYFQMYDGTSNFELIYSDVPSTTISELEFDINNDDLLILEQNNSWASPSDGRITEDAGKRYSNWVDAGADLTLDESHRGVRATTSSITITLPQLGASGRGQFYKIYNDSGGTITINPGNTGSCGTSGVDCIDGSGASITLLNNESITIECAFADGFNTHKWITTN